MDTNNCLILWLRHKQKQIMSFQGAVPDLVSAQGVYMSAYMYQARSGSCAFGPHLITPALLYFLLRVVARWEGHCGPCLSQGQRLKIPASWHLKRHKEWSEPSLLLLSRGSVNTMLFCVLGLLLHWGRVGVGA